MWQQNHVLQHRTFEWHRSSLFPEKSERRGFLKKTKPKKQADSFKHLLWNTSSSARWELDSVLAIPHKKNTHQTWYKLPLNWRRMEMHIMFNTFIYSWQLCSGFSVNTSHMNPFHLRSLIHSNKRKKDLPRCSRNHRPSQPLHSPVVILFCKLMCKAQQGSVTDYGPESRLGWIQDGCRGPVFQMFPNIHVPDHVRFFGIFKFHKNESVYPSREG